MSLYIIKVIKSTEIRWIVHGRCERQLITFGFSLLTGPGCFISAVETLSGRKAVVTGKPSVLVREFISKRHPVKSERTIIIGDM
jgi:hypothetical protein